MAVGFKVADAYVEVHVDDDTKAGRDKIKRDTDRWSERSGNSAGTGWLRGFMRAFTGLFAVFRGLLTALGLATKFALFGLAIGSAAVAVAGLLGYLVKLLPVIQELGTALISAAGALLLFPGAIFTLVTAIATLKLGLNGLAEAFKAGLSGDMEAFSKALEKLAPNAADFVREVVALKPAFDVVRSQIQNSLFADLAETLRKIAVVYLPVIQEGLDAMAKVINKVAVGFGAFLLAPGNSADIATILKNAASAADHLSVALGPALSILRDVLVVSTDAFSNLTGGFLPLLQGWADTISAMRADGSLAALITDGLGALKQFLGLAQDLLGILRGIFSAASGSGGLFKFFDKLNTLINSESGQKNLSAIFDSLTTAADALTPVLVVLLQALTPILAGIAEIAKAFSPGLTELVTSLGAAIAALAPGFVALAPLLTVVAESFMPIAQILVGLTVGLVPTLAEIFRLLSDALGALAPIAEPVGQALGLLLLITSDLIALALPLLTELLRFLAQVLTAVLTPLEPLVRQFIPYAVELFQRLFDALQPIIPVLEDFATTLVEELIRHWPDAMVIFQDLVSILELVATKVSGELVQAIADFIPQLPQLIDSMFQLAVLFTQMLVVLTPLIPIFIQFLGDTGQSQATVEALVIVLKLLVDWFILCGVQLQVMVEVLRTVAGWFFSTQKAGQEFGETVRQQIGHVTDAANNLKGTIINALANFGTLLYDAGRNLIQGLINGITSFLPNIRNIMSTVAQTVRNFWPFSPAKVGPLSGRGDMKLAGQNLVGRLVEGVRTRMNQAGGAAGDLAGLFGVGGPGAFAFAGMPAGGSGADRPIYVAVQVGDRPVREMVKAEITDNPGVVADATTEGNRVNAATSGRKRIGDT